MNNRANEARQCPSCFSDWSGTRCGTCGYTGSDVQHALALPLGTVLNENFVIGAVLGRPGGFGITYRAWDKTLRMKVAVKEYYPRMLSAREGGALTIRAHTREDGADFDAGLERFLEEARTLALFDHPNIVRVRTFFRQYGTAYLVMDFYEGSNLEEYVAQAGGKLLEAEALRIMMPVLDALREVHAHGFLHRDVKPQNIYITSSGRVILLDFGAAKDVLRNNAQTISLVYTPGFAAPEQGMAHGSLGPWTDVYSCAAVLWYMMTGSTPHLTQGGHGAGHFERGSVTEAVQRALVAALDADPRHRTQSMGLFQKALAADRPVGGTTSGVVASTRAAVRPSKSRRLIMVSAVAVLLLVVATGVVITLDRFTGPDYDPEAVFRAALAADSSSVRDSLLADLRMNAPTTKQGLYAIGDSLISLKKYHEVITICHNIIALDSLFGYGYYLIARTYFETGELTTAKKAIAAAQSREPEEAQFMSLSAKILFMQGEIDDAIIIAESALALRNNDDLRLRMIWFKNQQGLSYEALAEIRSMRMKAPSNGKFIAAEASILGTLSRYHDAYVLVDEYLSAHPTDVAVLRERAALYFNSNKKDLALQDINAALGINNTDAALHFDKAIYCWRLNMHRDALEAFNKAIFLDPHDAYSWLIRGDYRREVVGDMDGACADYERAVSLGNAEASRRVQKYCGQ